MTITYLKAHRYPSVEDEEEITTLASGDADADLARLSEHARSFGWSFFVLSRWVSDTSGDERCPDGKDVYRHHRGRLLPYSAIPV